MIHYFIEAFLVFCIIISLFTGKDGFVSLKYVENIFDFFVEAHKKYKIKKKNKVNVVEKTIEKVVYKDYESLSNELIKNIKI